MISTEFVSYCRSSSSVGSIVGNELSSSSRKRGFDRDNDDNDGDDMSFQDRAAIEEFYADKFFGKRSKYQDVSEEELIYLGEVPQETIDEVGTEMMIGKAEVIEDDTSRQIPMDLAHKPTSSYKQFIHHYFPRLSNRRCIEIAEEAFINESEFTMNSGDVPDAHNDLAGCSNISGATIAMDTSLKCPCCAGKLEEFEMVKCYYCLRSCCSISCSSTCYGCMETFCKNCSTVNYDLPFERQMCLDCNLA